MFNVSKQNINLNISDLCKLTASIREWCGEQFISRYDKTWDLILKNGLFEYPNNTSKWYHAKFLCKSIYCGSKYEINLYIFSLPWPHNNSIYQNKL